VENAWLHHGKLGSAIIIRKIDNITYPIEIVDCTGAGDGSLSGFILVKHCKEDLVLKTRIH
jgi:pseudouridine kinase